MVRAGGRKLASNPIPVLAIVLLTLAFEGLLFGNQLAGASFPASSTVDFGGCSGSGLDYIGCVIGNTFSFIINVFKIIFGVVAFFFNLVSFNVPGAPWFVRLFLGGVMGGALLWSIAGLFRGD